MLRHRTTRPTYGVQIIRMRECHRTLGFDSPRSTSSRSRRTPQANGNALGNPDDGTTNNADQLPPLPANEALAQAVSQVKIPIDGWAPLHVFKLFVVLVDPPPGLNLSAMAGLRDYLAQLFVMIGNLVQNRIQGIASRCWWVVLGKRSTTSI